MFILFTCVAFAQVYTILDENVDEVLGFLTSGNGEASKTIDNSYSGSEALEVDVTGGDGQKFNEAVPDWAFQIVENPSGPDQFRYITFAWRKDGGEGMQLQLHGDPDTWGHRYHAGANVQNWNPSIQVSPEVPTEWESQTEDLFTDWGEFTLTGIAFTAWDGNAGFWDAVYLHQDETLDLTPVEPKGKLATTWASLKSGR